jgi:hypothetical protein
MKSKCAANLGFPRRGPFELAGHRDEGSNGKVRTEQADRDANGHWKIIVRTAVNFARWSQPALDHLEPGAEPACD